jgi:hypothetical protein
MITAAPRATPSAAASNPRLEPLDWTNAKTTPKPDIRAATPPPYAPHLRIENAVRNGHTPAR